MDNLGQTLGIIAAVITGLMLLGVAIALIRGSYSKAQIEALRGDNNDLRARVQDLENKEERGKLKQEATEVRCKHLEQENETLLKLVTQRADVEAVSNTLNLHHTEAMAAWNYIGQLLERLIERDNPSGGSK